MPKTFLAEESKWFPEGSLAPVPDPDVEGGRVLEWALEPGDCVAFTMLTLHGSRGTEERRRAFSVRVMGDDIRHAPRTWRTSPEFTGLREQLADGAPMNRPLFPLLPLQSLQGQQGSKEQR
jgi:ectoine hydroxylase-related dioxygenase (phytanoyl-CoA dioxygenase family)